MEEHYQQIGFVGLRDENGSFYSSSPLYVKVSKVDSYGMTNEQEKVMNRISEIVMKYYDKEISDFLANKKKEKDIKFENKKLLEENK